MNTINKRFKRIRNACGRTQAEWGEIIGLSRSAVASIESGARIVKDKHIRLLCGNPIDGKYVNGDYLRTGDGGMFLAPLDDNVFIKYVRGSLADGKNTGLYTLIVSVIRTYNELSPASQEVIMDVCAKLINNLKAMKEE